jgi:B-block binding subunit of TFIIIC
MGGSCLPKLLLSAVLVALSALMLAVIWTPQPVDTPRTNGALWPENKSLEGLKRRLDRISKDNAALLKLVAQSGQYGIYVNDLAKALVIPRDEVVYRAKDLQTAGLVEVLALTDVNVRLDENVAKLLGAKAPQFIAAYLK